MKRQKDIIGIGGKVMSLTKNGNDLSYYENKLDIIIYLLNSTDNEEVKNYLIDEYNKYYNDYEEIMLKEVYKIEESHTSSTMDWI